MEPDENGELSEGGNSGDAEEESELEDDAGDACGVSLEQQYQEQIDVSSLGSEDVPVWSELHEKQLRSALSGACKRMQYNAEAHFHLGLLGLRSGRGEEALKAFQHALTLSQQRLTTFGDAPPRGYIGRVAEMQAHTAQAAHMAAITALDAERRAPCLVKMQADLIEASKLDNSQPDIWNAVALLHLAEGGYEGAREVLTAILRAFPSYFDALNNLGVAELTLGNLNEATKHFQTVISQDRTHVEALSNYGVVLLRLGIFDLALKVFEAVVRDAPHARGLAFAWGGLAVSYLALGRVEEAELAGRRAEDTSEAKDKSKFALLNMSIMSRRVILNMKRGIADPPRSPSHREGSSFLWPPHKSGSLSTPKPPDRHTSTTQRTENGKTGDDPRKGHDGITKPRRKVRVTMGMPTPSTGAGESSHLVSPFAAKPRAETDDEKPAIEYGIYRLRTHSREVNSSAASTLLGACLRQRHEFSLEETGNRSFGAEAAERLVEALEKNPKDACAWVQLALLQLGSGEYPSSRDFAMQAICRDESLLASWNCLGVSSLLLDELSHAEKAFGKALDAVRSGTIQNAGLGDEEGACDAASLHAFAAVWNNLGNMWRQEGRYEEAEDAYKRSNEAGGENAVVYNNLALLKVAKLEIDKAEEYLKKALEIQPNLECAISNRLKLSRLKQMGVGGLDPRPSMGRISVESETRRQSIPKPGAAAGYQRGESHGLKLSMG
uniref:UDP-N-acetylglucosamine--peptide N-acetylglucosaminyltransferase SPINDLY n=1 Tax=Compsopogon caeruleus TaxID=31354 RepID=A0A6T6CIT4_9RHOD